MAGQLTKNGISFNCEKCRVSEMYDQQIEEYKSKIFALESENERIRKTMDAIDNNYMKWLREERLI